jgi:hypothetical protein
MIGVVTHELKDRDEKIRVFWKGVNGSVRSRTEEAGWVGEKIFKTKPGETTLEAATAILIRKEKRERVELPIPDLDPEELSKQLAGGG